MAIPSGSGTEVLKKAFKGGLTNSEVKIIDGVANHIYTVFSVIFNEQGAAAEELHMYVFQSATNDSTNKVVLLHGQDLAANETFIWNDKFVLVGTDELVITTTASANVDVWVSYIDQDWT